MIQNKVLLAAICLFLSFSAPAVAETAKDDATAFAAGGYANALRILRPLADHGDADAQTSLGLMYYNGKGISQDYAEAAKWFRMAAEKGNGDAQLMLSESYKNGEGVPQDYVQAYKWDALAIGNIPASNKALQKLATDNLAPIATKMTTEQYSEAIQMISSALKPSQPPITQPQMPSPASMPEPASQQIVAYRGPATQALYDWDKAGVKTLSQIEGMPSGPKQRAMLEAFREKRANLALAASMEENVARGSSPSSLPSGNYNNIPTQEKSDNDFQMYEMEQKQQQLEEHQREMDTQIETDFIFNGR